MAVVWTKGRPHGRPHDIWSEIPTFPLRRYLRGSRPHAVHTIPVWTMWTRSEEARPTGLEGIVWTCGRACGPPGGGAITHTNPRRGVFVRVLRSPTIHTSTRRPHGYRPHVHTRNRYKNLTVFFRVCYNRIRTITIIGGKFNYGAIQYRPEGRETVS